MFRLFSKLIFRIVGWKVTGVIPGGSIKKSILIAIPHTSSWDFPIGILTRSIIKTKVTYIMKSSMFKPPFGWFFRWMDGMPVDRSKSNNFVDGVIDLYNERDSFHTVIAPEGTRKYVDKLKTGFYYIAIGAKIPIVMVRFDYGRKEVRFREPFYPSGDIEKDFAIIKDYFKEVKGKNPKNSWAYKV
jgi:1-acyl-sn-glycerol-3-phosphate acyltransferase